ncbi:MAG: sigma-70 family RNA polymerase sigma factor [Akkermansiaceae bacterium]|nr:sigma-70 family RNA polymerase sigma factor [Akkermansiaceae bacterium]NNM31042.1 sigma-70 family RNA polymerase sigma factor [Akkermansiaceae bacterium]
MAPSGQKSDDPHEIAAALLGRIAGGDPRALEELYERCAGSLLGVIMTVLRNREEAEDALQEVFVTIWKRAESYDPDLGKAISWMMAVARNRANDRARALGRQAEARKAGEDDLGMISRENLRKQWSPALSDDEIGQIEAALEGLHPDQREAIVLAYLEGLTQQEVAHRLQEPLGTVKARIRRGLLRLRHLLAGKTPGIPPGDTAS